MNKQKAMMTLYKSTWIVLVIAIYLKGKESNFDTILFGTIICMILATFTAMYLAAKESISSGYAKRNLTLAIVFTFFGGLGFIIWPFLVNSEIEKSRGAGSTTTNRPNEA
jgi:cytochrome bd-type quinol oxidase subunit 2